MVEDIGRLFVAVPISDEVRYGLDAHLRETLDERPLPGKPVAPESWHLTLRFLGKTDQVTYERIQRELHEAALEAPFVAGFGSLGAFPRPARATVLWLEVTRGAAQLERLAATAEEAAQRTGFTPEERPFRAHLTLSRIRPHQDVRVLLERVPPFPLTMPVERVVICRSHLGRGGARYEEMESFDL